MATTLIFPATGEELALHVTDSISIDGTSEITDFEVEEGSNITDHATISPKTISLTGFISDVPLDATGTYDVAKSGYHTEARERIESAWLNKEILSLDFGPTRGTHENYLIASFPQTWDADTGNGFNVSLSLKQIRVTRPRVRNLTAESIAQQRLIVNEAAFIQRTTGSIQGVNAGTSGTLVSTADIQQRFQPIRSMGRQTPVAASGALADLSTSITAPAGLPEGISNVFRGQ